MFTGIIEEVGIVKEAPIYRGDRLRIEAHEVLEGTKVGDSIAVNGVCLTVVSLQDHGFSVDVMPETLRRSNLGGLRYGDQVNLERALSLAGRLGGHVVLGHVDDTGAVLEVSSKEAPRVMKISAPGELMPYMVDKGFVAVDGVSLTIVEVDDFSFVVSLVAYTLENTTLGRKRPGDAVNLEADVIAKYLSRLVGMKQRKEQGLSVELLEQYGFAGGIDAD
jgi:riboflavin synthase